MTPHRPYKLENVQTDKPARPTITATRPMPADLECYMLQVNKVKAEDVAGWKMVPDYDVFKVLLKNGTVFEITGPLIAALMNANGID